MTLLGNLYAQKSATNKTTSQKLHVFYAFLIGKQILFGNVAVLAAIEALPIAGRELYLSYLLLTQFSPQAQSAYSVTEIRSSI